MRKSEVKILAILHTIGEDEVIFVKPDSTLSEAARLVLGKVITGLPVVEDGKVVGIISQRDLVQAYLDGLDIDLEKAETIMSKKKIITISPDHTVEEALQALKDNKIHRAPVIENDKLIGFLTRDGINDAFDTLKETEREEIQKSLLKYAT